MAPSGLEQRNRPLEDAYRPYGPPGLPAPPHLLDEEETPVQVAIAVWRQLTWSRSFTLPTWRDDGRMSCQAPQEVRLPGSKPPGVTSDRPAKKEVVGCRGKELEPLKKAPEVTEDSLQCQEGEIMQSRVPVTTIMIAALGLHLTRPRFTKKLAAMGYEGRYNFVYMPMQFGTSKNNGVAWVNFVSPEAAADFLAAEDKPESWVLMPAKRQGLEANASMMNKMDKVRNKKYRPMIAPGVAEVKPRPGTTLPRL